MSSIDTVREVVKELVARRRSFTGRDVFDRIYNRRVRRSTPLVIPLCGIREREASIIVRKLFNSGDTSFEHYGSCLTNGSAGPILYFPLPCYVNKRAQRINEALAPQPQPQVNPVPTPPYGFTMVTP